MIRTSPLPFPIAGVCLAMIAAPAAAQSYRLSEGFSSDPSQVVTRAHVPYSDIDPSSAAGARALLRRIETAADAVCGGAANPATPREVAAFQDCRSAAISGAVARAHSPALAALTARRRTEMRAAR